MTRRSKKKQDDNGRYLPNKAKQKSGLNKSILDKGWHKVESFITYKAHRSGKAVFKIRAAYTSQECAPCGYTHPDNRKNQDQFCCGSCGHVDNADRNAAYVVKKRAIYLIKHTGTVLSDQGVLSLSDKGRGASSKTRRSKDQPASRKETSKKIRTEAFSEVA